MPALEQYKQSDNVQALQQQGHAIKSTLHDTWGANAAVTKLSDSQTSNALDGFGQFCIGFGDGLSHFATESVQAVGKAVSNPGEVINNGVQGVKTAVGGTCEAAVAGAVYVGNKLAHGDVAGMTNDVVHTGEALGKIATQSIDHFNHMTAKEKGYVFGHDVAPTVVGTIVAPELIPEGAAAAAFGKVASVTGAFIKEESVAAKVATTFESAREKMTAISEKMAALNHKMEALQHRLQPEIKESSFFGTRKGGDIVKGEISDAFKERLAAAEETLNPLQKGVLKALDYEPVHNMANAYLPQFLEKHGLQEAECENRSKTAIRTDASRPGKSLLTATKTAQNGHPERRTQPLAKTHRV